MTESNNDLIFCRLECINDERAERQLRSIDGAIDKIIFALFVRLELAIVYF